MNENQQAWANYIHDLTEWYKDQIQHAVDHLHGTVVAANFEGEGGEGGDSGPHGPPPPPPGG